jgi:hypothetical protein
MQNEPNFPNDQMNVNKVLTKDYVNNSHWTLGENEPKTNPNEPNFKKAKMNVTSYITKGYENKPPIRAPKKQSQFSKRQKPMQPSLPKGIMKKSAIPASDKTNPTCRGVASGEDGTNPTCPGVASGEDGSNSQTRPWRANPPAPVP